MQKARLFLGLTSILPALCAGPARADEPLSCDGAFSAAPDLVKKGRLIAAHNALLRCSADACPAAMRPLCAEDLRLLEPRIPSVVFVAHGSDGRDLFDVRVVDGEAVVQDRLDGRAIEVDPGPHVFRFERPACAPVMSEILVREGERARAVAVELAIPSRIAQPTLPVPAVPATPTRPIPWTVYLAGGVAVAATVPWAYFGIEGISERSSLDTCKGHCDAGAVQAASDHLRLADGFMAASLLGYAATALLFATRPTVAAAVVVGTRGGGLVRVATVF